MATRVQDIIQRIGIEGAEQVLARLKALGKEGSQAFRELDAAVKEANKGLGDLGDKADEAGDSAEEATEGFSNLGIALTTIVGAALSAGAALTALVVSAGNAIREISGTAEQIGLTANELQRLQHQARLSGVESDVLTRALIRLQSETAKTARAEREHLRSSTSLSTSYIRGARNVTEYLAAQERLREQILSLVDGNEEAAETFYRLGFSVIDGKTNFLELVDNLPALEAHLRSLAGENKALASQIKSTSDETKKQQTVFERLGISVLDAAGNQRPLLDIYDEVMEKLSGMANLTERNQILIEAFGIEGIQMVRVLQNYRAGADEAADALERLNLNLSAEDQANAEAWGRAMGRIGALLDGLRLKIGAALLPAWTALADIIGDWLERIAPGLINAVQLFADAVVWATDQLGLVSSILLNIFGEDVHGTIVKASDAVVAFGVAGTILITVLGLLLVPFRLLTAAFRLIPTLVGFILRILAPFAGVLRVAAAGILAFAGAVGGLPAILTLAAVAFAAFLAYLAYENWDAIKQAAADTWRYIVDTASTVWDEIKSRWDQGIANIKALIEGARATVVGIWDAIKQAAIAVWNEIPNAWQRGVDRVTGIINTLQDAGRVVNEALVALAVELWSQIEAAYNEGVATVQDVWNALKENVSGAVEQVTDSASQILESLTSLATTALQALEDWISGEDASELDALTTAANAAETAVTQLGTTVVAVMARIVAAINRAIAAMKRLEAAAKAAERAAKAAAAAEAAGKAQGGYIAGAGAGGGGGGGFSLGGPVWGGGNSTSDSIFARLSRGEYVIRAAAVLKYGRRLFDMLNNMLLDVNLVKGFNVGGLIEAAMPKFQSPASIMGSISSDVKPKTPLLLQLPNGQVLEAGQLDDNAVDQLLKHTIGRGLRTLGRVNR